MLFISTHSAKTICTNKKKEEDNMAHEKHYEVWENMTAEMVDSQLKYEDRNAATTDEYGNELPYANLRGCSYVQFRRNYDGHTEKQKERNENKFLEDEEILENLSNGSAIARLRESGFLAYSLKAEFDSTVSANKYPLRVEGIKMADRWGFPTTRKFKNATELKSYVKNYGRSTLLNHYIYDKDSNRIGMISKDQSHFYKKRPKKIPAKYTAYGTVYDWGILNDCHC